MFGDKLIPLSKNWELTLGLSFLEIGFSADCFWSEGTFVISEPVLKS